MIDKLKQKYIDSSHLAILTIVLSTIFIIVCIFGEGLGGSLGSNPMCYKYLGCTIGFAGYDALEHFLFGIASVWVLIWIFKTYSKYSLLHENLWKNIITILALVVLLSVLWEFAEWLNDVLRADFLHQTLVDWKLRINLLSQPSNIDTMGDLLFALAGSITALLFTKKILMK